MEDWAACYFKDSLTSVLRNGNVERLVRKDTWRKSKMENRPSKILEHYQVLEEVEVHDYLFSA